MNSREIVVREMQGDGGFSDVHEAVEVNKKGSRSRTIKFSQPNTSRPTNRGSKIIKSAREAF
jgi:hypothetical protein